MRTKWTHLTVFDLDRTLIKGNCSFDFCRYLVAKGVLPFFALLYAFLCHIRHLFLGMSLSELHERIFSRLLKGRSSQQIEENVEPFLEEYLFSTLYQPCFSRLRLAQHLGHYTLILSNSPSFLVNKITKRLGVDASYSTEYLLDPEKRLQQIGSIMEGSQKASCVRETAKRLAIEKNKITAYSDSFLDWPLLLAVGEAVAVNPDPKLKEVAKKQQWEIL